MNEKDTKLGKTLSWILRHAAVKEGLALSSDGYIAISQLLRHRSFSKYTEKEILHVVNTNDKQRYKLKFNDNIKEWEIKANQGHTIQDITNQELIPILEAKYPTVIHGTFLKCWPTIKHEGLSRMKRKHIHFAKGLIDDPNVISGIRKNAQVLIYIDLAKALANGLKFYESENGVILTEGDERGYLKPENFLRVMKTECGFPPFTSYNDLKNVFSQYGAVNIKFINKLQSVVTFLNAESAEAAVAHSGKLCVYGDIITVKPYNELLLNESPKKKDQRLFVKSKEKSVIIPPTEIDLSGDFYDQMESVLAAVRLTQEEVAAVGQLYSHIETVLSAHWPGCEAFAFGSIATGLGIKTSDADCYVEIPAKYRHPNATYVNVAKKILQNYPHLFQELISIPKAHTPIVKFFYVPAQINCDLSFKTPLGTRNSELIALLLHSDPRLLPVAVLVKYWAKVHGFAALKNYAITMLLIFYFQQASILPSVEYLQRDPATARPLDGWNAGFSRALPRPCLRAPVPDLLAGFFRYYASFDFERLVVCPLLGHPVEKAAFEDAFAGRGALPPALAPYAARVAAAAAPPLRVRAAICVQDPFELSHNVASAAGARLAAHLVASAALAAAASRGPLERFLPAALLHAPARPPPAVRVRVCADRLRTIEVPRRRHVIADVVEAILSRIFLAEVERCERAEEAAGAGARAWGARVRAAVWRGGAGRGRWGREPAPLDTHAQISREIAKKHKLKDEIKVNVRMCPSDDGESATVKMKLEEGNPATYKELAQFFSFLIREFFCFFIEPSPNGKPADSAPDKEVRVTSEDGRRDDAASAPRPAGDNTDTGESMICT